MSESNRDLTAPASAPPPSYEKPVLVEMRVSGLLASSACICALDTRNCFVRVLAASVPLRLAVVVLRFSLGIPSTSATIVRKLAERT